MLNVKINLTGMRFSRISVIREYGVSKHGEILWDCVCDCGNKKILPTNALRSGRTKSCGCYGTEKRKERMTTHGDTGNNKRHRIHRIWSAMLHRCNSESSNSVYHAKRGISVCDEWFEYITFKEWALSSGYKKDLSIDRIDNDKGYFPENCRWVGMDVQSRNKRSNHNITIDGVTKCMKDWSDIYGISYGTLTSRINILKWEPIKALTHPVQVRKRKT